MAPLQNLQNLLLAVSTTLGIIAVMTVGIIVTIKMTGKNKEGFREALSSISGVLLGIIITTGAVGFVGFAAWIGTQIFG